jgi:hypothetical protein
VTQALHELDVPEGPAETTIPVRTHLTAVSAVSGVATIAIIIDAARTEFALPSPMGALMVGLALMPWVVFAVVWGIHHLETKAITAAWAEGFVSGVKWRVSRVEHTRYSDD